MSLENLKDNWGSLLIGLAIIALGIYSFMSPDSADMDMVHGRRSLIKVVIVWLWGWPLGIAATIFGSLICLGAILPDPDEKPDANQ